MRDRPTGAELLAAARKVLREDVVGRLEGRARFDALMAANAMAIAARQLDFGEEPERRELARLADFYGETPAATDSAGVRAGLARLNRRLAADIRAGLLDPPGSRHEAARRLVEAEARQRVRESNPRYLEGEES